MPPTHCKPYIEESEGAALQRGELTPEWCELRNIALLHWQQQLAWVGQNPHLPASTLQQNILLSGNHDEARLHQVLELAHEFLPRLPARLDSETGN